MKNRVNRSKSDIFSYSSLAFIFKHRTFILVVRLTILLIFTLSIIYGFIANNDQNKLTNGFIWGFFWPFFTLITLSTFGGIFCGICPHAFVGKYLNQIGPRKKMPPWMKKHGISLTLLIAGYWFLNYGINRFFQVPIFTSSFFTLFTVVAFLLFYFYRNMDYCKYICPFSAIKNAFSKVSFAFLSTYTEECKGCSDHACRKACNWNLKPMGFGKAGNMDDCTLCMSCAQSCEAVKFSFIKPGAILLKENSKLRKIDVWVYQLLIGVVSFTMVYLHTLKRSDFYEFLPWVIQGNWMNEVWPIEKFSYPGILSLLYSILLILVAGPTMIFTGSKLAGISFKKVFYTIGFGYAPLMIIGSLNHVFKNILISYIPAVSNAFIQLLHLPFSYLEPLISHDASFFIIFNGFDYIAVGWTIYLLYKRSGFLRLVESKRWLIFLSSIFPPLIFLFNKILVLVLFW